MMWVSSGTISCDGRTARPPAGVDRVLPDHPAQEQVETLAAAAPDGFVKKYQKPGRAGMRRP